MLRTTLYTLDWPVELDCLPTPIPVELKVIATIS